MKIIVTEQLDSLYTEQIKKKKLTINPVRLPITQNFISKSVDA